MKTPWIMFDGLGITLEGVERGFEIGGFSIYWYGILIAAGFLLAVLLGLRVCRQFGFTSDDILTYIIICAPAAIVCARIYFVIFHWETYMQDWTKVFHLRGGGLAIYGGVIGVLIAAFIATRIKKQSLIRLLDFAMPYVLIGQAIGRWGNFFNQEAYGVETTLPWGMSGSGIQNGTVTVHPNFFYEFLWCTLIFFLIVLYKRKARKNFGELMCLYFIGYGIGRAVIESIRGEDTLMWGSLRVSMWLSILFVVFFSACFLYLRFIKPGDGEPLLAGTAAPAPEEEGEETGSQEQDFQEQSSLKAEESQDPVPDETEEDLWQPDAGQAGETEQSRAETEDKE